MVSRHEARTMKYLLKMVCEMAGCKNRATARKYFVDEDGFWTCLCESCGHKICGWRL